MDGVIVINKPQGLSSHSVVNKVRKILNTKKVGHTGTLDPLATGVLPILVGQATKISKYLIEHDKIYVAKIQLGSKTNTGDLEGEIIETKEISEEINELLIEKILKSFIGMQKQTPPIYSAIKVNGKKLYEYARNNENVEIPSREIEIHNIELKEFNKDLKTIEFLVKCSKGTYIRTLCEDISKKLDTLGYMKELQRINVDRFNIESSITIGELENNTEYAISKIISIEKVFEDYNKIKLNKDKLKHFLNGVKITQKLPDGIYKIYDYNSRFIGIGVVEKELLKRDVIVM